MITLSIGWLTLFLIGIDLFVVSPLLPQIAANTHVGIGSAGWMVSAFSFAYIIGGPAFGAWADRLGRRRVLAITLSAFAVSNLLTGLAPTFPLLLGARGLAGLSASGVTPSVYALVGSAAPEGRRATWLSIVTSGLLLALSTGVPAGTLLAEAAGWRGVFLSLSAFALLVLVFNLWAARGQAGSPERSLAPPETISKGVSPNLVTRIRAVSLTSLWGFAVYGVYTYLGAGLHQTAGLSSGLLAAVLSFYGLGALAGNLIGGPLADRIGAQTATTSSLFALAVVEAAVAGVLHQHLVLFIGLALFALAAYPFFSAQQTRLIIAFPDFSGSLLAWNNTALYVGILLGSAVGGRILDAANFTTLVVSASAVALLAGIVSPFSVDRDTLKIPDEASQEARDLEV